MAFAGLEIAGRRRITCTGWLACLAGMEQYLRVLVVVTLAQDLGQRAGGLRSGKSVGGQALVAPHVPMPWRVASLSMTRA